jgi:hypothetical protein
MPLQKLQFRPGVNREGTTLSNEGGYFDCDKIRFRSGFPEKIGGWQKDAGIASTTCPTTTLVATSGSSTQAAVTNGVFWGVTKGLWNWINLTGYNLLGVGTNLKYYIQNSSGGAYNDVTPIRVTTLATEITFTATSGSTTIQVNDAAHGAQVGDFVCFSSAVSLGGAITATVLNREYQVQTVTNNNTYTITSSASAGGFVIGVTYVIETVGTTNFVSIGAASSTIGVVFVATGIGSGTGTASPRANGSDTGTGGAATIGNYQLTTGFTTFTLGTGWGAGGWGGSVGPSATTALTASINSSSTAAIAVTSTTGFTIGTMYVGTEGISFTAVTATTFAGTITRGVNTTAAAHTNGDAVYQYPATATGWGSPATTGIGIQLRLWSQSNYGEDLVINPRGGAMYYWANNASANVYDRCQIIKASTGIVTKAGTITPDTTCPSLVNFVLISDSSRFTFAFGTNDPTGTYASTAQDPMQIRWSDQNTVATWTPAITNQAGGIKLSHGSQIITAIQTRQEILVFTDAALYSFQYLGAPYVWGNQLLGDNISIAGPNVVAVVNNVTYWMGADKFYVYSGRIETLPCSLRQFVFDNINLTESYQFCSGTSEGYSEVWWFYCSMTGTTSTGGNSTGTPAAPNRMLDRYVIYNHLEKVWYYGTWNCTEARPRTAWLDSPLRAQPIAGIAYNSNNVYQNADVVYHETTVDNNETSTPTAIDAYVQSSDFDIGDGHNFGFVWRLIPDITFNGSTSAAPAANFSVRPRTFPGANYGSADDRAVTSAQNYTTTTVYNVQLFTEQVYVRIRGRQMAFKIESTDLGTSWQLGVPRIDVRPDGRR